MPKLVCMHGNNAEEVFAIREGVNRIGRCPDTAIKLFDNACSRAHAEVYRRGDYVSIEDLGSRHGTFVNGRRIAHRIKLYVGDRIDIGHTVLKVAEGEAVAPRPPPPEPEPEPASRPTETQTQEISAQLLAAKPDMVKQQEEHPKGNLFRRLFGDGTAPSEGAGQDGGGRAGQGSGS
jgi:pSer/pThr/pTyr-binding forkhead associated (FHA) protein